MKKYLLGLVVVTLVACHSNEHSTNKETSTELMFPYASKVFNWKNIEKQNPGLMSSFVKQTPSLLRNEYDFYTAQGEEHTEKEFESNCHILDINNDGVDDIIYTGSTGSEGEEVVIFLNTKGEFKQVLKQVQYIVKLDFQDHKLFRLYIEDTGCCDEWIDFHRVYQIKYNNNIPEFNTALLTSSFHTARFPRKYFSKPIHFNVLNDNYKMHLEPSVSDTIIDDFTYPGHSFKTNNNIDTLVKGTKGRAIAAQKDETGRVWWLVEIDQSYAGYGNLFYEQQGDSMHRASKIGWISSRYLKKAD
ncbi:MAG: hypothetical protein ACXVB0_10470 [Mucilaginibacter sp.]